MKVGILYSENINSIANYIVACENKAYDYQTIDLTKSNWFDMVSDETIDFFVQRPEGSFEYLKIMWDERLYVIEKLLGKVVFPTYEEVKIYENKKMLSYYLKAKDILSAQTDVFYHKDEALSFINNVTFPIVAKTSIGAAGSGVVILRNKSQAEKYIKKAFSNKGITRRFGPNKTHGNVVSWTQKAIKSPSFFIKKLRGYFRINGSGQRGYVIFQEYIEHDFELRVTKCGNYYYAYQKLKMFDKCSGSGSAGHNIDSYLYVFDFVRNLCETNKFNSMSVDLLITKEGKFIVNELQTHWGVDADDYMIVKDRKGIYKYENNNWVFIEGDFWVNEYFDMRLDAAVEFYKKQKSI